MAGQKKHNNNEAADFALFVLLVGGWRKRECDWIFVSLKFDWTEAIKWPVAEDSMTNDVVFG